MNPRQLSASQWHTWATFLCKLTKRRKWCYHYCQTNKIVKIWYILSVYCVMTNQSEQQDMRTSHKIRNLLPHCLRFFFFHTWLALSLHHNIPELLLLAFQCCEFHSKSYMCIVKKTSWGCMVFMSIVLLVHKSTIKIHQISPLNVGFEIDTPHNLFALYMINFRNDENIQCTWQSKPNHYRAHQ